MFSRQLHSTFCPSGLAAQAGVYAAAHLESMNLSAIVPASKRTLWLGTNDRRGRLMR